MLAQASTVQAFVTFNANSLCTFMPNFCFFIVRANTAIFALYVFS